MIKIKFTSNFEKKLKLIKEKVNESEIKKIYKKENIKNIAPNWVQKNIK